VKTLSSLFKGENGLFGLNLAVPLAVSLLIKTHIYSVHTLSRTKDSTTSVNKRECFLQMTSFASHVGWMHETTKIEPFIWFSCSWHAWLHTTHEQTPCWQTSVIYGFDS